MREQKEATYESLDAAPFILPSKWAMVIAAGQSEMSSLSRIHAMKHE